MSDVVENRIADKKQERNLRCQIFGHQYVKNGIENGRKIDPVKEMAGFRGKACFRCGHIDIYLSGRHTATEY